MIECNIITKVFNQVFLPAILPYLLLYKDNIVRNFRTVDCMR